MTDRVLLLTPSAGLGGGIERYLGAIQDALQARSVPYVRHDLCCPGGPTGSLAKLRFLARARQLVQDSEVPVRVVAAHRNLLPVVRAVSRLPRFSAATVILYGCEIWSHRRMPGHRMLSRRDVRVVTISNFSAGALAGVCAARVLHPGISARWYRSLVDAGSSTPPVPDRVRLVTVFRLPDWREKGLPELLEALSHIGDDRVDLIVCGSGPIPDDLRRAVAPYPWCLVEADLTDPALAARLAGADLFVLATRFRTGAGAYGEGFGLVLLEAQLAGTAVIAPAFGGSGDAFQPGITGLSPADESSAALATTISELLSDGDRRARMGRAAAEWSREICHPDRYADQAVRTLLGSES